MKYVTILLLPIFLVACGKGFSDKKVMSIRKGTSAEQIQAMFGAPHSISVSTCGVETDQPWSCTNWEYDRAGWTTTDAKATFTFYTDETDGELYLDSFDIDRDHEKTQF